MGREVKAVDLWTGLCPGEKQSMQLMQRPASPLHPHSPETSVSLEWAEENAQRYDYPIPHPSYCPNSPPDTLFLSGRWLFYLLASVLFCKVGGSMPIAQDLYGEVTSPLYPKPYPNNFETTTVITVPTGYRVKLVFWQFDLEPSEDCFYDYVKVGGQVGWTKGELGGSGT